ncbi:energy transducer TonB [Reichenbachiella sp. MALMAid0571]|uniref:energy transducer TonB n=1 Tax=Reichenbachiella sp. MALMAid0571 TaxID=3143939 RepID=UPI0032E02EE2
MHKSKKPKDFLKVPQYPGGKVAMTKFINENLKYPQDALENKIEGTVEAEYFVDGLGKIKNVNILKGLGHGCDEEVERLIKSLVFDKAVNRGLRTSTRKTLKINFNLPKKKTPSLQYQLVKAKPKKEVPEKKNAGYNITISYTRK